MGRNKVEIREANNVICYQGLVHIEVKSGHTEAIRRIMIRLVDLEKLDVSLAEYRSSR